MTHTPEHLPEPDSTDEKPKKVIIITAADAVVLEKKLRIGQYLAIGSYIALLLFFTASNLLNDGGSLKTWLVQVIPLVIFIPGLLKQTHRTYSWICFVSLAYFVAIIPLLMGRWLWSDWVITILISILFAASMMTSRWLQYWHYYLSTKKNLSPKQ